MKDYAPVWVSALISLKPFFFGRTTFDLPSVYETVAIPKLLPVDLGEDAPSCASEAGLDIGLRRCCSSEYNVSGLKGSL